MPSLEQLKKKKELLLKQAGLKNASLESLRARKAEKKKLQAEIFALEHPGSDVARERLKKVSNKFSKFVKEKSNLVAKNAVRLENERRVRARADKEKERELEKLRLKHAMRRKSPAKKKTSKRR